MDRDSSFTSDPASIRRRNHPVLPPWEVRSVSQVPFMEPGSPSPAHRDEQGFFTPPPNSHANVTKHRPKLSASMSAPCGSEYCSPVSEHSSSNPWKTTVPLPTTTYPTGAAHDSAPYERPAYEDPAHFKPAFRKTASQPTAHFVPQAPPTPPDSMSRSSLRSASASPPIRPASKALPGTMSSRASRNRSSSHNRAKNGRENRAARQQTKQEQGGIGHRFKSAFRDIFKKDPVDESQFERISDRHWTDEY